MKKIIFILLLLQLIQCKPEADIEKNGKNVKNTLPSSNEVCSEKDERRVMEDFVISYVTASPYLNVRANPSISSEIIDKLEFNATVVKILRQYKTDKINGKTGHWVEVKYGSE